VRQSASAHHPAFSGILLVALWCASASGAEPALTEALIDQVRADALTYRVAADSPAPQAGVAHEVRVLDAARKERLLRVNANWVQLASLSPDSNLLAYYSRSAPYHPKIDYNGEYELWVRDLRKDAERRISRLSKENDCMPFSVTFGARRILTEILCTQPKSAGPGVESARRAYWFGAGLEKPQLIKLEERDSILGIATRAPFENYLLVVDRTVEGRSKLHYTLRTPEGHLAYDLATVPVPPKKSRYEFLTLGHLLEKIDWASAAKAALGR
jgi:hypothetical protein